MIDRRGFLGGLAALMALPLAKAKVGDTVTARLPGVRTWHVPDWAMASDQVQLDIHLSDEWVYTLGESYMVRR